MASSASIPFAIERAEDTNSAISSSSNLESNIEPDMTATSSPPPPSSSNPRFAAFTLFPNLQMELQLKIWKLSLPGPRVIQVKVFAADSLYDPDYQLPLASNLKAPAHKNLYILTGSGRRTRRELLMKVVQTLVLSTTVKSPGPLFACNTSREEALKKYTRCFELKGGLKTRFDPTKPTASLSLPPLPYVYGHPDSPDYDTQFSGVENIAISWCSFGLGHPRDFQVLFSQFLALKKLVLIGNSLRMEFVLSCSQSDDGLTLQPIDISTLLPETRKMVIHGLNIIKIKWMSYLALGSHAFKTHHLIDLEFAPQNFKHLR